jgi:putative peptidoglycan lipid II flippase
LTAPHRTAPTGGGLHRRIFSDTLLLTVAGIVSQGIGFLLTILIARRFGANTVTDSYYLALIVPGVLVGVVSGTIKIVFVPIFIEEKAKRPECVDQNVSAAVASLLLLSGVSVVGILALTQTGLLDFGSRESDTDLTRRLIVELLPLVPLAFLFGLFNAVYNSYQRFALAEVAQGLRFLVMIFALLVLAGPLGIHSLVVGSVGGQALATGLLAWVLVRRLGLSLRPRLSLPPGFRRMVGASLAPFGAYVFVQMNPFVARFLAAFLPEGSVTILSYAEKLASLPGLVIGVGFTGVLASYWSKLSAEGQIEELRESLHRVLSVMAMVLAPVAIGLVMLREPLVDLILVGGAFDRSAAALTADVLAVLALMVLPAYLHMTIVRVLLARQAMTALFWISLVGFLLSVSFMVGAVVLGAGVVGIALGLLGSAVAVMMLTAWFVHVRYASFDLHSLAASAARVATATASMAIALWAIEGYSPLGAHNLAAVIVGIFVGGAMYIITLRILRHPDLAALESHFLHSRRLSLGPRNRDVA